MLKTLSCNFKPFYNRYYSNFCKHSFTVTPFCNVKINFSYNLKIEPLDFHEYPEYNKLLIHLHGSNENGLNCAQNGDEIFISSDYVDLNTTCFIKAPIKTNFDVKTKGKVAISNFQGEIINIKTDGNITAQNCVNKKFHLISSSGDIACNNMIQAADIILETRKSGSITTDRLQGINLLVKTENGDIFTTSSYCSNSKFETVQGNVKLQNAHKDCKVLIMEKGNLYISGFDGTLIARIKDGYTNIQLSRIEENSTIIQENGSLIIGIAEECLQLTEFRINSQNRLISKDLQCFEKNISDQEFLLGPNNPHKTVTITAKNSEVKVDKASWLDNFKFNFK